MSDITDNATTQSPGTLIRNAVSFLADVIFYLFIGSYIFTLYSPLRQRHSWAPDPDLHAMQFIGALIGFYVGGVAWFSRHFLRRALSPGRSFMITVPSMTLISAGLLTILHYPADWRTLGYYAVPGAVVGAVAGLISTSGRGPWNLIIRGVGAKQREAGALALIGGVVLRLGGVLVLLFIIFVLVALQNFYLRPTPSDFLPLLCVLLHPGLTILVAFTSPRRWIALLIGLLLNLPLLLLVTKLDYHWGVITVFIAHAFAWAIFIAGRAANPRNHQADIARRENRAPVCLGGR